MTSAEVNIISVISTPNTERINNIQRYFTSSYGKQPQFLVRVPGRVNLIGEHIDYCGYGVCPMAIEQDVLLAVAVVPHDFNLKLNNTDPMYESYECNLNDFKITVEKGKPHWYQYFLCGVKGILDILPKDTPLRGFAVTVSGNIPPNAGLSSSSALVSAAALATAHVHKHAVTKEKMANLCAECERYIGTQGGGMDQAIAFLATEGCAKLIDFNPLRSKDVTLPLNAVFVIAHSLVRLNKAATSDYNCRVVECRLAAQILAKRSDLDWTKIRRLKDVHDQLDATLPEMISLVEKYLTQESYTKNEVLEILETTSNFLEEVSLTSNTWNIETFQLRQRALHVFQEAHRVEKFYKSCCDLRSNGETTLQNLGRLMTESHTSLRDLYECSHPQLDRLVELSKKYAYGARLTGAGWGGCAVALVPPDKVKEYIVYLREHFYGELGEGNDEGLVFATSPNSGACIYQNVSGR